MPKGELFGLLTRIAATVNRFVVHANDKLTAFLELERITHGSALFSLICNQQVVGLNPTAGSVFARSDIQIG
jgi:hypothetical protein